MRLTLLPTAGIEIVTRTLDLASVDRPILAYTSGTLELEARLPPNTGGAAQVIAQAGTSSIRMGNAGPVDGAQEESVPGKLDVGTQRGIIAGATVFLDANKNGVLDFLDLDGDGLQDVDEPREPLATSDASGRAKLTIPISFDRDSSGDIASDEGQLVVVGGIDVATGTPLLVPLIAPTGSSMVTPFTTLMAALVNTQGMAVTQAERRVAESLGLASDLPLRSYDPIAGR